MYSTETEGVQIVGTISAYISNRATGDTLRGLSIARDVSHFHETISFIKTLDEARAKKQAQVEEQKSQPPNPEMPPTTEPPPITEPTPKPEPKGKSFDVCFQAVKTLSYSSRSMDST